MENQNKNGGLYVLIVILGILVLGLGGYIVYDKVLNNKPTTANKDDQTNNPSGSNENALVSKLDNSKDWVYDAEYEGNVAADSYETLFNATYYAKDIVVPYININSSDANAFNNDIKKVFDDIISAYNEGVSDKTTYIKECSYKDYIISDNLSVLLTYGVGTTGVVHPKYFTYNIDLKTGNKLSYEEVYTIAGFNSNNIDSKVESAITKTMKEEMKDFKYPDNYPDGTNFDTYNNESISNYKKSISTNTLKYFLSADGKLNIVVELSIPADSGKFDTIITVD